MGSNSVENTKIKKPTKSKAKTAIFLSVRDKATRLPNKISRVVQGKKVIEHLVERLKRSNRADLLVVTTSTHPKDEWFTQLAANYNILCFRGSEDDKLKRYFDAANHYQVDFSVVVDGDDIFCDPGFIDSIIEKYHQDEEDYIVYDNLPLGVTGFGIKTSALEKVMSLKKESDTEVWGSYFTETGLFKTCLLKAPAYYQKPDIRMTLDYEEDLAFFEKIFNALYVPGEYMSFEKILNFLDNNPEVLALNSNLQLRYESNIGRSKQAVLNDIENFNKVMV